ncbi:hypothetical protein MXB_4255, partial [Myxobolus squamalis]
MENTPSVVKEIKVEETIDSEQAPPIPEIPSVLIVDEEKKEPPFSIEMPKEEDENTTEKSIIIYFYLRYNVVSSILGLNLLNIKNFPGPDEGGFNEIR